MPLKYRYPIKISNRIWDIYLGILNLEALKQLSCIVKCCKINYVMGFIYFTIHILLDYLITRTFIGWLQPYKGVNSKDYYYDNKLVEHCLVYIKTTIIYLRGPIACKVDIGVMLEFKHVGT